MKVTKLDVRITTKLFCNILRKRLFSDRFWATFTTLVAEFFALRWVCLVAGFVTSGIRVFYLRLIIFFRICFLVSTRCFKAIFCLKVSFEVLKISVCVFAVQFIFALFDKHLIHSFSHGFLLFVVFFDCFTEQPLGDIKNFFESLGIFDLFDPSFLIFVKLHTSGETTLEVDIQTVDQLETIYLIFAFSKEAISKKLLVRLDKLFTETRVTTLDQFFDPSIFYNIKKAMKAIALSLYSLEPLLFRRVESMSNFMTDKVIICVVLHVIPHGQCQNTVFQIKRCGLDILVNYCQVLLSQQTGENFFRLNIYHLRITSLITF